MFEHPSGRPLPTRREIEETAKADARARKAAEERAQAEAEARKVAEAELARLRAEIDRLRKTDTLH
jgi:membrane protein involved in colicin uptake